jgi:agmatinase
MDNKIGNSNFLGLTGEWTEYAKSKVVILPVPYGKTVSYGKGTENGPRAIITASKQVEYYDEEIDQEPFEVGIYTAETLQCKDDPKDNIDLIESVATKFVEDDKFIVMIGGEHSISTGMVKALQGKYDDFCVLQIDAHSDLREEYEGSENNHACVMRRISRLGVPIIQVGIRAMDREEKENYPLNGKMFPMHWIVKNEFWMDKVLENISKNVYISIDLDAFDSSLMPATGTPEPGGFQWWDLMHFLRYVFKAKNVIGCDVVELAPIKDMEAPNFLAAKLVYKLIGYKFEQKNDGAAK